MAGARDHWKFGRDRFPEACRQRHARRLSDGTADLKKFLDDHGVWKGNDYYTYCGNQFGGDYEERRGPLTVSVNFKSSDFVSPLTELEKMNGGRDAYASFTVRWTYEREWMASGIGGAGWRQWGNGGEHHYGGRYRTTTTVTRQLQNFSANTLYGCAFTSKPRSIPK